VFFLGGELTKGTELNRKQLAHLPQPVLLIVFEHICYGFTRHVEEQEAR
jgi:hypothetical protein